LLTDQIHVNLIVTFARRQTLAGDPGWLTSHRLNDAERTTAMATLKSKEEVFSAVDRRGVEFTSVTLANIDWAGNKFFPTPLRINGRSCSSLPIMPFIRE
jgi:hypothetical protein